MNIKLNVWVCTRHNLVLAAQQPCPACCAVMQVYHKLFPTDAAIIEQFEAPKDALEGAEVLYAYYEYADYSGDAMVVFRKDGKLYEALGSHCSCYGLEGQWDPEETSIEALKLRDPCNDAIKGHLQQLVSELDPENSIAADEPSRSGGCSNGDRS